MRITSLVENSRLPHRPDLQAEHGVSLHVQHGDLSLAFLAALRQPRRVGPHHL